MLMKMVLAGSFGAMLAHMGYNLTAWEFWASFAIFVAYAHLHSKGE